MTHIIKKVPANGEDFVSNLERTKIRSFFIESVSGTQVKGITP
jgi:hypothetical protein